MAPGRSVIGAVAGEADHDAAPPLDDGEGFALALAVAAGGGGEVPGDAGIGGELDDQRAVVLARTPHHEARRPDRRRPVILVVEVPVPSVAHGILRERPRKRGDGVPSPPV